MGTYLPRLDYTFRIRIRSRQLPHVTLVYTDTGPRLSAVGICQLGYRSIPLPDIRCRGRKPGTANTPEWTTR